MPVLTMKRFWLSLVFAVIVGKGRAESYEYYDDASWAVVSDKVSDRLGSGRPAVYNEYIRQCHRTSDTCGLDEAARLEMNANQPGSVYNYTSVGFLKTKVPDRIRELVQEFWDKNRHEAIFEETAIAYHNAWDATPTFVLLSNSSLVGGGPQLVAAIVEGVRERIEAWTGMQQALTSIYGIRIYHNNSILTPHVDRNPLISSAIINVAQDVDEPWPLEVYDHDGHAHNVTMEPWDMVLYESHSIIHGRPFPMRGKYFANFFVHFEALCAVGDYSCSLDDLPPYIIPGSPLEQEWRRANPRGRKLDAMRLTEEGDLKTLQYIGRADPSRLSIYDYNGWQPIHLATYYGFSDIVRFLVKEVGISANTKTRKGFTPLDLATSHQQDNQALIDFLIEAGAEKSPSKDEL